MKKIVLKEGIRMKKAFITRMKKTISIPMNVISQIKEGEIIEIQITKLYIEDRLKKEIHTLI